MLMGKRGPFVLVLDRKVALIGTLTLVLLLIGIIAIAGPIDTSGPWHFLQSVAKGPANQNTVDANNNGIIDEADSCTSCAGGGGSIIAGVFDANDVSSSAAYPASDGWFQRCEAWAGNVEHVNSGVGWSGASLCRCGPGLVTFGPGEKRQVHCLVRPVTTCTVNAQYDGDCTTYS